MAEAQWSLRNIYLYVVCLITLIMVIVGAAGTIRSVAELVYPDAGYYYGYYGYTEPYPTKPVAEPSEGPTEEQLAEQERYARAQSVRQGVLSLAGNLAMVFIAGPIYLYHWRKIEMEHGDKPVPAPLPAV
jgi:hypothetical protein